MILGFVQIMKTLACSKKQKDKTKTIFCVINVNYMKARIIYLADIFAHINQLNKTLQGQNVAVLDCAKAMCSFMNKLSLWKLSHLQKNEFAFFCIQPKQLNSNSHDKLHLPLENFEKRYAKKILRCNQNKPANFLN